MRIIDIKGKHIKINKTSITVKNPDTGKTAGVVKDICKFMDLQPNKQIDYYQTVCKAGLWGSNQSLIDNVVLVDGELYYLYNMKKDETFERYYKGNENDFPSETKHYLEYNSTADKAAEYMQVIKCYID